MLAVLLTLGYFCHLVSLGLTILGLIVLSVAAPCAAMGQAPGAGGSPAWRERAATFIPVVILGLCYLSIATQRAPMRPLWGNLSDPWSPRAWVARLEWADPLSLAIRDGLPFTDREGVGVCFVRAGGLARHRRSFSGVTDDSAAGLRIQKHADRRGWFLLAAILIVGGVVGPDSLGEAHGDYLPQRIVLLGLVALVPIFDIDLVALVGARRDRGAGCRRRPPVGHRLGLRALFRPHRGPDHPRPRRRRPRPEDRDAAGFDPKPVSSQSLTSRRELAGSRYGQRDLEQLRDAALLLPGAFPAGNRSAPSRRPRVGLAS